MVTKCMYCIYIYKSLLVNVSVSLIVSEVLPQMTLFGPPYLEMGENTPNIQVISQK